jgi:hypothetical protein
LIIGSCNYRLQTIILYAGLRHYPAHFAGLPVVPRGRCRPTAASSRPDAPQGQILSDIQIIANPKLANNQGGSALTNALMKGYTRIAESLEMAEVSHKYEPGEGRG